MPDISMCSNALCPSKEYCYRFTAIPTPKRQSYMGFAPEEGENECDHFYPNGICKYCHQTDDKHKMSCPTQKIQINI